MYFLCIPCEGDATVFGAKGNILNYFIYFILLDNFKRFWFLFVKTIFDTTDSLLVYRSGMSGWLQSNQISP